MSAPSSAPSQVRNVAVDAPEDYGTIYNVMHEPDCDTYCEAWDWGDGCDEMVRWWLTLPDSDSASNLVGICERHFRRDFEPVSNTKGAQIMSWSFSVPAVPKDQFPAAVDAAQATGQPPESVGLAEDVAAAKAALKSLAGRVKRAKVGGSASGHALQASEGNNYSDSVQAGVYGAE